MASRKSSRKQKKLLASLDRSAQRRQQAQEHAGSEADSQAASHDPGPSRAQQKALREVAAREKSERSREEEARRTRAREEEREARLALSAAESARREPETPLQREWRAASQDPATGWRQWLRLGVAKTREGLAGGLGRVLLGRKDIAPDLLPHLEEVLLGADLGPVTVERLLRVLERRLRRRELADGDALRAALKTEIAAVMAKVYPPERMAAQPPTVLLFVGVNGTGKTTTIGKLAARYTGEGKTVVLGAGDTFRAAAAEQLAGWAERAGAELVRGAEGDDPGAVVYRAVARGLEVGADMVLCDTAGRLHTKVNLMEELKKIKRTIAKLVPEAPHEVVLVLDANTGQNAILQTRDFHGAVGVTGLIVTKLDGTARGGVLVGIVNEFDLPVRYVGVGEGVADLQPFDPLGFADSLFD